MSNFANWISPEVLRTLGWTLLHFLWQGAGLAALFVVAAAVCRSASGRYALAVSALVLMMASPVVTFIWLRAQANTAVRTGAEGASTWAETSTQHATALTGLTEAQIEAVIAHELAHIRRLDCFVNLFQIATETLLFYHPAVWWVSQRIRAERENCCDDEAIVICGDAVNYARALTLMEEWRTAPALMMAANRGPLAERVMRLLGWNGAAGRIRVAGLAGSFVCLVGALLAGNAFLGIAHAALGASAPSNQEQKSSSVIVVKPETTAAKARTAQAAKPAPGPTAQAAPKPQTNPGSEPQTTSDGKKQSYIDAMAAAGIKITDVDELIALKIQGVTP